MSHKGLFENARMPISLTRFMELMRPDATRDLVRRINRFLNEMETVRKPEAEKDSYLVQRFLNKMEAEMVRHRIWGSLSETDRIVMLEVRGDQGVELYCMTKLYKRTFGRYRDDQKRDQLVSSRLFALQFVTPAHLDIPADVVTHDVVATAMRELQKINAFQSPKDKLACVLNCCQVILDLLHTNGKQTGADAFTPVLNYVVIKTQPLHLISNIEFIRRFRKKSRLVSYAEYYFTQLCAVACFIESAHAESFTDGKQEFLSSFLQQGLINWKQYEEAMEPRGDALSRNMSFLSAENASEISQLDGEPCAASSSADDLRSLPDEQPLSATNIDWNGLTGVVQLEREGSPVVSQMAAGGELLSRHPFLTHRVVDLKVESVDHLLAEYKALALSYEVLSEAVERHDAPSVLRLITEYEIKAQWRSVWPSQGQILIKYPFLCSSFQDLSLRDISKLLNGYKHLVLHCEALIAGAKRRTQHDPAHELHPDELETLTTEAVIRDPFEQQPPLITRLTEEPIDAIPHSAAPSLPDGASVESEDANGSVKALCEDGSNGQVTPRAVDTPIHLALNVREQRVHVAFVFD